jgi:outer membrane protein
MRLIVLILALAGAAQAQQAPSEARPAKPKWELGVATLGISQQAYPGSDQQVNRAAAVPYFIYRGEWLRADEDGTGLRALRTENFELDLSVAGSLGADRGGLRAREGMPRLGTLVELGPLAVWKLGEAPGNGKLKFELPVRAVFDLSDGGSHKGWAAEPELIYQRRSVGGWRTSFSGSLVFGDRELGDTFYGVAPRYARANRPAYAAKAGFLTTRLSASFSKSLSRDWQMFGFTRFDSVAGAANKASPLVRDTNGFSFGLGVSYTWLRSSEAGSD